MILKPHRKVLWNVFFDCFSENKIGFYIKQIWSHVYVYSTFLWPHAAMFSNPLCAFPHAQSDKNTVNWSVISKLSAAEALYTALTSLSLSFICSFSPSFVFHRSQADAKTPQHLKHNEERGRYFCGGAAFCLHYDNGVRTAVILNCPTAPLKRCELVVLQNQLMSNNVSWRQR